MSQQFNAAKWIVATKGLDSAVPIMLRSTALNVVRLARTPKVTDTFDLLASARGLIVRARRNSPLPDFWPGDEINNGQLLDWLQALADFTTFPSLELHRTR